MSVSVVREVGGQGQRQGHQSVSPGGGDDELRQLRSRWRPRWTDPRREFSFSSLNTPAEGSGVHTGFTLCRLPRGSVLPATGWVLQACTLWHAAALYVACSVGRTRDLSRVAGVPTHGNLLSAATLHPWSVAC